MLKEEHVHDQIKEENNEKKDMDKTKWKNLRLL